MPVESSPVESSPVESSPAESSGTHSSTDPVVGGEQSDPASSWIVELALGLGLLLLVQQLFAPEDPGLLRVSPHPLLALVAVVAVRHGNPAGLLGGLVAAVLHVVAQALTAQGGGAAWALRAVRPEVPLELLAAGGLLAELVRGTREDLRQARAARKVALEHAQSADAAACEMAARFADVERRLVEPAAQVAQLHRHVSRLDSLDEPELLCALVDVVREHLGAGAAWVYLVDGTRLVPRASVGAALGVEAQPERSEVAALCEIARRETRVASPRDLSPPVESAAGRAPRTIGLAAPLLGRRGAVLGVVAADAVPFLALTDATERVLEMLADMGARALERARLVRRSRVIDEATGLATYAYLCDRLAEELHRSRRHQTPLSVLVACVARADEVPASAREGLLVVLAHTLRDVLRQTDVAGHFRQPMGVAAILPCTDADGAGIVATRLREAVAALQLHPHEDGAQLSLAVGTVSATESTRSPADLVAAAEATALAAGGSSEGSPA